jgi:hypothetical protein
VPLVLTIDERGTSSIHEKKMTTNFQHKLTTRSASDQLGVDMSDHGHKFCRHLMPMCIERFKRFEGAENE